MNKEAEMDVELRELCGRLREHAGAYQYSELIDAEHRQRMLDLRKAADTLAAQAAELEQRWRPIEGAAEGVPVLVTSPEWTDGVPAVAGYASQYDDWYLWGDGGVLMPKPTHWMPLPSPPAIADSGAGVESQTPTGDAKC